MFHLILNIILYLIVENLQPVATHVSGFLHALVSMAPVVLGNTFNHWWYGITTSNYIIYLQVESS